jgi:hypothetical protein
MRGLDDNIDLSSALQNHYDPRLAEERVQYVHGLFSSKSPLNSDKRRGRGWDAAYDLRPWNEFPDTERITIPGIILQNLIPESRFGTGGGPTRESNDLGEQIRETILSLSEENQIM